MELEMQLLVPVVAFYDDQPLTRFRSNKTQAPLIYMLTEAAFAQKGIPRGQGREQLMALLWPGMPQFSAQVDLRQIPYQLRQMVPEVSGRAGQEPAPSS